MRTVMRSVFVCVQLLQEEDVYPRLARLRKHRRRLAAFGASDVIRISYTSQSMRIGPSPGYPRVESNVSLGCGGRLTSRSMAPSFASRAAAHYG